MDWLVTAEFHTSDDGDASKGSQIFFDQSLAEVLDSILRHWDLDNTKMIKVVNYDK